MGDDTNLPIDLTAYALRRRAVLSRRPAPRHQRQPNWLDFSTNNVAAFFAPNLPRGPRCVMQGEVWLTTTALDGSASYLASDAFLQWRAAPAVLPPRPKPSLTIAVFDRERPRTAPTSNLTLV